MFPGSLKLFQRSTEANYRTCGERRCGRNVGNVHLGPRNSGDDLLPAGQK